MSSVKSVFQIGGVIAYPTEAVFGLGYDPDNQAAIEKLLAIKNRPKKKGLILLAGDFSQLIPYLDISTLSNEQRETILNRWPNGITQVLPAKVGLSSFLTGQFSTIAVRVTTQKDVVNLCKQTGKPIVSTSANLSGLEPAKTWEELDPELVGVIDYIVKGDTLAYKKPSKIINGLTGEVFRT